MAGRSLNTAAILQCPHFGKVTIVSFNARALASAGSLALSSDQFTVTGCQAGSCVRVVWLVPDVRVSVNGIATLSETSIGVCVDPNNLPQGPVVVLGTQFRVTSE
jgi:hypothetical protein